jgi:hypothetical protein
MKGSNAAASDVHRTAIVRERIGKLHSAVII